MAALLGDLIGKVFGFWLVLALAAHINGRKHWYCHCLNCEPKRGILGPTFQVVAQGNLTSGASVQCRSCARTRHGGSRTVEYQAWLSMHARCKSNPGYLAKGIKVCERWSGRDGFKNFLEDMGPRPQGGQREWSVGRINPLGNYEKDNCRWETIDQQAREKTTNVVLKVNGTEMIKEDWARAAGLSRGAIDYRLSQGKTHEEAVLSPSQKEKPEERTLGDCNIERRCKHCAQWKTLSTEYHKNPVGHSGYSSMCIECKNAASRKRDTEHRRAAGIKLQYRVAHRRVNGREERWCGACPPAGAWKLLDEFGFKKRARRRSTCKSCHSAQRKVVCREPQE